jgi:hypothetical protein
LNRLGADALAEGLHPCAARVAVVRCGAHLDQLMGLQRAVHFRDHFVCETLVADDDDGRKLVRV